MPPVWAQGDSGRVVVDVRGDGRALAGARVASGGAAASTNAQGRAVLVLPAGRRSLTVALVGFRPDTSSVLVPAGAEVAVRVELEEEAELAPVVVTSTRQPSRIEDQPTRVEVLAGEEVGEQSQMRPADVTLLLQEMSGMRVQTTAPALGGAGVRVQGLPARYTAILSDGLPLYATQVDGLSLLQVPPLDLRQVEVIKGASTALYGPSALGGVVDLVSRLPSDTREMLVNRTSESGTDAVALVGDSVNERWGYTVLAGAHAQQAQDINGDGWADIPEYRRAELEPRFFWRDQHGRAVFATAGAASENRIGGTLPGAVVPNGQPFVVGANTDRAHGGLRVTLPLGRRDTLTLRTTARGDWERRSFGPTLEHDRFQNTFGELTLAATRGPAGLLAGAAFERDAFHTPDVQGFDYTYTTPSLFAQTTIAVSRRAALTASGRCDWQNRYGTICSPRGSLLVRGPAALALRLSGAGGFFAPTPFTDETQDVGLARLQPPAGLAAERARYAALDLTRHTGALELNGTLFTSTIANPLLLRPQASIFDERPAFANAPGPTWTSGAEFFGVYTEEPLIVTLQYAYLHATEISPFSGGRVAVPLDPAHSAGLDVAWESDETGTRIALEVFYTGVQTLLDDPYLNTTPTYTTVGVLVSQHVKGALVFLNGENLGNVRQASYEPLLRPAPDEEGRWTVDEWAPFVGRTFNLGLRLSL